MARSDHDVLAGRTLALIGDKIADMEAEALGGALEKLRQGELTPQGALETLISIAASRKLLAKLKQAYRRTHAEKG